MSYALFSDGVQISRAFPTRSDVWRHAEASGLVVEVDSADEDPPRKVLDMACTISPCAPADAANLNQRIAAAAS